MSQLARPLLADLIGAVQSGRTLRGTKDGGAINSTSFPTTHKVNMALGKMGSARVIKS